MRKQTSKMRIFTPLWILSLLLATCSPAPTASPAPAPTTVPPSPTLIPTIVPTPTMAHISPDAPATLNQENWVSHIPLHTFFNCILVFPGLASGEVVLGLDSQTCQPLNQASNEVIALPVELPSPQESLLVVTLHCNGNESCMYVTAPQSSETGVNFSMSINNTLLWSSDCGTDKACASDQTFGDIQVSYRVRASDVYRLELATTPGAIWRVSSITAELQPLPSAGTIRGFGYSPYRDCQTPNFGPEPSQAEVDEDLERMIHTSNGIRTYSSQGINADIVRSASQFGFIVAPGVSIGKDANKNEKEIEAVKTLVRETRVDFIIIGNEVMLRGDQDAQSLAAYLRRVKAETGLPVAYADIGSWFLQQAPDGSWGPKTEWLPIINAADILLVHIYPYWDGVSIDNGAVYVADRYEQLKNVFRDKRVVIGETGWPSRGLQRGNAVASLENQRRFFYEFTAIAEQRNIDYFYFAPFEEPWKTVEGEVGPSWGIVTAGRVNKFESDSLLVARQFIPPPGSASIPPGVVNPTPLASSTVEPAAQGVPPPSTIYNDFPLGNLFVPDLYEGDQQDLHIDACSKESPHSGRTDLSVEYTAASAQTVNGVGWAGVLWNYPPDILTDPNRQPDFSFYKNLSFYARGEHGGERVAFLLGGNQVGDPPSSVTRPLIMEVTLSAEWQRYAFDLGQVDLSRLTDAFGWVVSACKNPDGATFHLDDIQFGTEVVPAEPPQQVTILEDGCLNTGFDLGIDTSRQVRDWAAQEGDSIRLDYPSYQQWGAAYIYVNQHLPKGRPSIDLSRYSTLAVEMRGQIGGERVSIGVKDANDPDSGKEPKSAVTLESYWQTYYFDLSDFSRQYYAELDKIYIPIELVFGASSSLETVYIRSVKYLLR